MVEPEELEAFHEHTNRAIQFYLQHKGDTLFHDTLTNFYIRQESSRHAGLKGLKEFFPCFAPAVELYARGPLTTLLAATTLYGLATFTETINDHQQEGLRVKPEKMAFFRQEADTLARTVMASSESIHTFHEGLVTLLGVHAYQRSASPLDLLADKEVFRDVYHRLLPQERSFLDYQDSCWNLFAATINLCPETPSLCYIDFINDGAGELEKTLNLVVKQNAASSRTGAPENIKNINLSADTLHPDSIAFARRFVAEHRPRSPDFKEAREALQHYHRQWTAEQAGLFYC